MKRSARDDTAPVHVILFLAANPSNTGRLALDREARAIQRELEHSGDRDRFEFQTRWAAEPLDLLRELRALRPLVVHFSGHGAPSSESAGLMFGSETGGSQIVTPEAIAQTFGAVESAVRLVVLNACYSTPIAEALLAHVDCVVGMTGAMHEDAARSFAIGFYGGLGEHASIAAAFAQGKAAIHLDGLPDADQPQLRVCAGLDAAKVILAADTPSAIAVSRPRSETPSITADAIEPSGSTLAATAEADQATVRSRSRWRWVAAVAVTAVLAVVVYKLNLNRENHDAEYRSAVQDAESAVRRMCDCRDVTCVQPSISSLGIDLGFLESKYKALSKSDFAEIYATTQNTMKQCIDRIGDAAKADNQLARQIKDILGGAGVPADLAIGQHDYCAHVAQNLARFRADHARSIRSFLGVFLVKPDATFTPDKAARGVLDSNPSCKDDPGVLQELTATFSDTGP